jgi:nesprin-2
VRTDDSALFQVAAWRAQLDDALPSPLKETEAWLKDIEGVVQEGVPTSQSYSEARTLIQGKLSSFKVGKETHGKNEPFLRVCP